MNDLTIYDTLAESWWQAHSQLHMLARMNPARFAYFDTIVERWQGLYVLDLGCGGGLTAACLAQRGAAVVGIDLSCASLHVASRHARGDGYPTSVFACGRAESLPFPDTSFDVVWCTDVLEHLHDLPTAIAQIARVLKPGVSSYTIQSIAPGCPAYWRYGFGNTSPAWHHEAPTIGTCLLGHGNYTVCWSNTACGAVLSGACCQSGYLHSRAGVSDLCAIQVFST